MICLERHYLRWRSIFFAQGEKPGCARPFGFAQGKPAGDGFPHIQTP